MVSLFKAFHLVFYAVSQNIIMWQNKWSPADPLNMIFGVLYKLESRSNPNYEQHCLLIGSEERLGSHPNTLYYRLTVSPQSQSRTDRRVQSFHPAATVWNWFCKITVFINAIDYSTSYDKIEGRTLNRTISERITENHISTSFAGCLYEHLTDPTQEKEALIIYSGVTWIHSCCYSGSHSMKWNAKWSV